jgi:hypothetical protein
LSKVKHFKKYTNNFFSNCSEIALNTLLEEFGGITAKIKESATFNKHHRNNPMICYNIWFACSHIFTGSARNFVNLILHTEHAKNRAFPTQNYEITQGHTYRNKIRASLPNNIYMK